VAEEDAKSFAIRKVEAGLQAVEALVSEMHVHKWTSKSSYTPGLFLKT
jgi:acetylglutamate kinase